MSDPVQTVLEAAKEFFRRETGESEPVGVWQGNKDKPWWVPDNTEQQSCCLNIMPYLGSESRLFLHCCSMNHVSTLYKVPYLDLHLAVELISSKTINEDLFPELWTIVKATEKLKGKSLSPKQVQDMALRLIALKRGERG